MGHPDKLADQISDAILDEFLKQDSSSKVACETFITDGLVVVGGEAFSEAYVDIQETARKVIKNAGYEPKFCFDPDNCGVISTIHAQSQDIRNCVDREFGIIGAGDQGIMFGYAVDETPDYMPLSIKLANETMRIYDTIRKEDDSYLDGFGPDAKCQYTVVYEDGKPKGITTILISAQHEDSLSNKDIQQKLGVNLINDVFAYNPELEKYRIGSVAVTNPSGRFVIGGPKGDTGLTGRKIIVDTYGGRGAHGGGAFSGKDPTKVDRSAAYMARYLAKNIVAAEVCSECLIQLSYMIGIDRPVSIYVKTDRGEDIDEKLTKYILKFHEELLTPYGIIKKFGLMKPIYLPTATYGHFGRNPEGNLFPWEKTDMVDDFRGIEAWRF